MHRITERVENYLDHDQVENFHEFMSAYTDIFNDNLQPKITHIAISNIQFEVKT